MGVIYFVRKFGKQPPHSLLLLRYNIDEIQYSKSGNVPFLNSNGGCTMFSNDNKQQALAQTGPITQQLARIKVDQKLDHQKEDIARRLRGNGFKKSWPWLPSKKAITSDTLTFPVF
jgi:hypothetical protein